VTVLRNSKKNGWGWGMWANVGAGLTWAYENLSFKYAFKIDCDALIINYDLDCFFEKMFSNPKVGIVAHFQNQQNHRWIWSLRISRKFKELAKKNGYFRHEDEEQCFWSIQEGVEAFSYKYIAELIKNSNFDEQKQCGGVYKRFLGHKGLWEGPLFVVLCYAYGFEAIDMPVIRALFQKDELHKIPYFLFREMGLRAIHPLKKPKSANDINLQVRAYFQGLREKDRLIRTQ
jgi:hypothetical protein